MFPELLPRVPKSDIKLLQVNTIEQPSRPVLTSVPADFYTALQSASYVIVLVSGFLVWNSRKWFQALVEKHFSMITQLQKESQANLKLTVDQHATIEKLILNNNVLTRIVVDYIKDVAQIRQEVSINHNAIDKLKEEQ